MVGLRARSRIFRTRRSLEFAWSPDYKRLVLSRGRMSDDIVLLKGLR